MNPPRKTIVLAAIRLLIALMFIAVSSAGYESGSFRRSNLPETPRENQDDCDLEKLKKQLKDIKEKEDGANKAVANILKEIDQRKALNDKYINSYRDLLSPEEQVDFDKAVKKYNKAADDYDVALSKANSDIAKGVDPKVAKHDAGVDEDSLKKEAVNKALDEMFKATKKEQEKQEAIDLKKAPPEKVKEGVKKVHEALDEEVAAEEPKPKEVTKFGKMKSFETVVKSWNDIYETKVDQLTKAGVKLKEVEKERKELQKKLKEAEEKCLEPVASGAPTFTAPGYDVKIVLENGLLRIHDTTPFGVITTNLPADLKADEKFSGTNYLDPAGKTNAEREKNIAKLKEHNVSIGGRDITNWTGMIGSDFLPYSYSGQFASYRDLDYGVVFEGKPVIGTRLPNSLPPPPQPTNYVIPTGAQQGGFITIPGPFDGVVSPTDSCTIGGSKIPILAESPHSRVVWNTSQTVGPSTIAVGENGQTGTCQFNNVSVKLSAPKLNLVRGETTTLTIVVSGLEGLKQDVPFELVNHSPGVVSMAGGNQQSAIIHASDLQANGTYTTTRTLTGVAPGSFNITATVHWKETCKPSMEVMRLQKSAPVTNAGSQ